MIIGKGIKYLCSISFEPFKLPLVIIILCALGILLHICTYTIFKIDDRKRVRHMVQSGTSELFTQKSILFYYVLMMSRIHFRVILRNSSSIFNVTVE